MGWKRVGVLGWKEGSGRLMERGSVLEGGVQVPGKEWWQMWPGNERQDLDRSRAPL
jgi:hypothetical protein